ncbi:MAG: ribulose-phosphate 3-epimerase [Patescibacteria group bacterium]|nr:MAG: ribulose-phosphate 3-epimerase [Patescibacteria group bacterium]
MQIIPALLEKNQKDLTKKLRLYTNIFSVLHIDIADNTLVNNTTLQLIDLQKVELLKKFRLDLHLMTEEIDRNLKQINNLKDSGYNINNIFIPFKTFPDLSAYKKHFGLKQIYLYLDPTDEIENVLQLYKKQTDLEAVLILTVNPGFQGSPFIPYVLNSIYKLQDKSKPKIFLDGGINDKTAAQYLSELKDLIYGVCLGSYFADCRSKNEVRNKLKNIKKLLD